MNEEFIRIEGPSEDLKELRQQLIDEVGGEIDIQPVTVGVPGELREPLLAGLVVAVPPSVAITAIPTVGAVINRFMKHRERMEELSIYRKGVEGKISAADLLNGESDS